MRNESGQLDGYLHKRQNREEVLFLCKEVDDKLPNCGGSKCLRKEWHCHRAPASPRTAAQHLSRLRSGSGAGPGAADAHRAIFLEKRVAAAEAAADRAREELLRACERAESANAAVERCRELRRELEVRALISCTFVLHFC